MCSFLSCFLTFLHYVQKSAWVIGVGWLRRVGHTERRKKRKKQKARVIRLWQIWRKEIGWSKVKISWLAFIVIWCEECEKSEVPECEDWCSLEELLEWEQAKREEKNREGKRKYTVRKRAVSEKKKWVSLLKLYF